MKQPDSSNLQKNWLKAYQAHRQQMKQIKIPWYQRIFILFFSLGIHLIGGLIPPLRKKLLWKGLYHSAQETVEFYKMNPELEKIDSVIKTKMEETKIEDKDLDPFDEWSQYIQLLQHEMEQGRLSQEDVAALILGKEENVKREAILKRSDRLSHFFNEIQELSSFEKMGKYYDQRLNELMENNPQAKSELEKFHEQLQNEIHQKEKETKPTQASSAKKRSGLFISEEEYQKKMQQQQQRMLALNPEIADGLVSSDFYKSQTKQNKQHAKVLENEHKVLRKKLKEQEKLDKSLKQVGQEKQKAEQKLKKKKGSVESSI